MHLYLQCTVFGEIYFSFYITEQNIYVLGGGSGDPHITTIDGRGYTMNGHAEYILAKSVKNDLQIQARTERAVTEQGALSDATIFSAFALQVTGAWVQAELNRDKTDIRLFTGKQHTVWEEITINFQTNDFSYNADGMKLIRDGDTLIISFIDAGNFFYKANMLNRPVNNISSVLPFKFVCI